MSHTRKNSSSITPGSDQPSQSQILTEANQGVLTNTSEGKFLSEYPKEIGKGIVVGTATGLVNFPLDKLKLAYDTMYYNMPGKISPSFYDAVRYGFKKIFSGLFLTFANAWSKNALMFPAKYIAEQQLNKSNPDSSLNPFLSGAFANLFVNYAGYPIVLLKTLRLKGVPISKIYQEFDLRSAFPGVHTTAAYKGIHGAVYFGLLPPLSKRTDNPLIAGTLAGFAGSFFSNPLAVAANIQRTEKRKKLKTVVTDIYKNSGIKGFYPGFATTTLWRMGLNGAVTAGVIKGFDKVCDAWQKPKTLKRG